MDKKTKSAKFLKNRVWKSKFSTHLRGRVEDVYQNCMSDFIEHGTLARQSSRRWLGKYIERRKLENQKQRGQI